MHFGVSELRKVQRRDRIGKKQHAPPAFGHRLHLQPYRIALRRRQVAQVGHGLGRALGGQQVLRRVGAAEHTRHGQHLARERVLELRLAPVVHMLGALQPLVAKVLDGLFHGIERIARRGQHRELGQPVKGFRQMGRAVGAEDGFGCGQPGHRHAVDGERAGLVHRQYRDRTQRLHSGHAPREHLLERDAPRPQRQEHGEDHRDFLGQDGHGQRNAREQALQQRLVVPPPAQ